jgi:hypothetical protein
MLPTTFRIIWPSGFRGEDFLKSANQKQELPVVAMCIKFPQSRMKGERHRLGPLSLLFIFLYAPPLHSS